MSDLKLDWLKLAPSADTGVDGHESGGTKIALEAIRNLLGDDVLVKAVHHYLSGAPGSEVAYSVLRHLRSLAAVDECYRLFLAAQSPEERRGAVELLRSTRRTHSPGCLICSRMTMLRFKCGRR